MDEVVGSHYVGGGQASKAFQEGDQTCRRVLFPLVPASGRTASLFAGGQGEAGDKHMDGGSLAGSLAIARRRSSGSRGCRCADAARAAGVCGSYYNDTILSGGRMDEQQQWLQQEETSVRGMTVCEDGGQMVAGGE